MSDWQPINDRFYAENGGAFVVYSWNGIAPGNHGRQSCSFMTGDEHAATGRAKASIWADDAIRFDTRAAAQGYLEANRHPKHDGWGVSTLAGLVDAIGYRPNTAAAIIGRPEDEEEAAPPAP